ncbi:hypothetical protein B0X70_16830 [Photorhabdus akhurstii]|uniref:EF-hand domain-containing protein n=1 Tax=Photorhabdus akhurstii TaxID=171438 RepID=A0ABX8LXI3_9GAMM|nr:hypothetical protein [Photorhabdus akhurstii]QXF34640.1 hypothetical protein B0X70_16830 [Photorhabdus akhurstii]
MKICFPVSRENDGQPYQATDDKSLQAMLAKLRSEPNGAWLVGANGLWHGGVHLSDRASAPYSKLTPDLLQQNKVMPLRCMAEGEVVAYRLNKAYLQAPYFRDEQLKYSSTFALVKSEYKAQDETLLTFYSLYMHLAPVSDYPAYPRYRAIVQHTLNTHRFTANNEEQYGIPFDVTERGERRDYDIPPTNGSLKHGDEFLVYQTADFFMTTIISTRYDKVRFGLAQKLEGGVVKDKKKFWVELDPQFVEQTGEACPQMPVWMQTAVKKGAFDSVQTLMGDEVIRINVGDPIGHLGLFESPAARLPDRMSYYFTHIEVLSADDNLPDFVNNTKRLADGRKYVICGLNQMLHSYDATHKTFTPLKVRTQQEIVLAKALTSPVKDKNGVNWYKVTQTGWVKQNGELVTEVDQHDLNKLGFRLLEEEATTDFSKLTAEECVKVLLRHLLAVAKQDRRIDHALVPVRYERILRKLDKDGDGQLNAQEVRLGLYNPEMINVVTRFIVKHSSEWYEDSQGGPWENFFTNVVKNRTANKFWRQYLDDQVWMKEVEPFSSGKPVWHMHPVVFLDYISVNKEIITLEMLIEANLGKNTEQCQSIHQYINKYAQAYDLLDRKEIAHFLSQIGHESGFVIIEEDLGKYSAKRMREIFGCKGGQKNYNRTTDTCILGQLREKLWTQEEHYVGNARNLGNYVYSHRMGNGDEASGDGYKYRGRGMIQITGRSAYRNFTFIHNKMNPEDIKDFENNPDLVINNIEYGVESAFAFWISKTDRHGVYLKDLAKLSSVREVTQVVNGGQNGYADRLKRYNKVALLLGLEIERE